MEQQNSNQRIAMRSEGLMAMSKELVPRLLHAFPLPCIVRSMIAPLDARAFANEWVAAWNSHDLEAILTHYAADVILTSPVAAKLLNDPSGTVRGKTALRDYFTRGLETYPNLHFELLDVMCGLSSVVLYYVNQKGSKTAEFMEFDDGKVIRVVANYSS